MLNKLYNLLFTKYTAILLFGVYIGTMAGCTIANVSQKEVKEVICEGELFFNDKVTVTSGFFKGLTGEVKADRIGCEYMIRLSNNTHKHIDVKYLNKIEK